MLEDGLYGLRFVATDGDDEPGASGGLAVLRSGTVLGSDPLGAVFTGTYEYDDGRELNRVRLRLDVPPDGVLVNGYAAGPHGATLHIAGAFPRASVDTAAYLQVAGSPISVEIRYLGPLPN